MVSLGQQHKTDVRKVIITDVNLNAKPNPVIEGRDVTGGIIQISATIMPPNVGSLPRQGETWWAERRTSRWVLYAKVISDPITLQQTPNWDPQPDVYNAIGTIIEVDHPSNHSSYSIDGRLCNIFYSQYFAFAGNPTGVVLNLPLQARVPRNVFSGDIQNEMARALAQDSTTQLYIFRHDGSAITNGNWHVTVNGTYEWLYQ